MISQQLIFRKIAQVLLHCIFWIGVLLFYSYFFETNTSNRKDTFHFALFLMPITIATTYVATHKLIPDYLITKRYWRFVLYSTYTFIVSLYLLFVSIFFSLIYISNFQYAEMNPLTKSVLIIMTAVYLVVIIVSAFKLLKLNLKQTSRAKTLETKILETQLKLKEQELNYLKMQIHPHFLFNTLNTMYGFALKKANQTPDMILKLSNLLDYLLYQAKKPSVLITEEIEHIKDYIDLEKMRFNDTLNIDLNINIQNKNLTIAPMLLLPFVENSFKHGNLTHGILDINIKLEANSKAITFQVENTATDSQNSNSGIGLENIKKRLELLYPNTYELHISNQLGIFKVILILNTLQHDS